MDVANNNNIPNVERIASDLALDICTYMYSMGDRPMNQYPTQMRRIVEEMLVKHLSSNASSSTSLESSLSPESRLKLEIEIMKKLLKENMGESALSPNTSSSSSLESTPSSHCIFPARNGPVSKRPRDDVWNDEPPAKKRHFAEL